MRVVSLLLVAIIALMLWLSVLWASPINFSFQTYDGKRYKLSDFRGRYVLVNLFSSYCPPCMVELKVLERLNKTCSDRGLQIISLMIDREGAVLLPKIVSSRGLTYPVGLATQEVLRNFSDFSITPTTYLLDPNGNRIEKFVGYKSYDEFIRTLTRFVKCN